MGKSEYQKEREEILSDIYNDSKSLKTKSKPWRLNENTIIIFTIFLGVSALFVWVFQMKSRVTSNFGQNQEDNLKLSAFLNQVNNFDDIVNKDTDFDGLSDYDELYIYHTSPYLEDSDSDGISDFDEIKNGTDPNCPEGQICKSTYVDENPTGTEDSEFYKTEGLRQLLISLGVPAELIADLTEEELTEVYYMILDGNFSNNQALNAKSKLPSSLEEIKSLPPAEIRQILEEMGIDPELLRGVSDEELISLVEESL